MKMDKYELVLDIIEHSEKYTPEQLAEIMSDPEVREIYSVLCKTDSAVETDREIDVDAEWEDFSRKHGIRPLRHFIRFGSRAASIAAIVLTSVVAVAAGIAVTVAVAGHEGESVAEDDGGNATTEYVSMPSDSIAVQTDTVRAVTTVMFEDEPLEAIMKQVATAYGVEVRFNNNEVASLHLYYRLDPSLPLDEVVAQLNTFEQIDIKRDGNSLTID